MRGTPASFFSYAQTGGSMKTIKAASPYQRVEIEIGNHTVEATLDLTPGSLVDIAEACSKAAGEAKHWQKNIDKAQAEHNAEAIKRTINSAAKAVSKAVKAAYGEECFEAVLTACGDGKRVHPSDAFNVLCQMVQLANECISEIQSSTPYGKATAAQYLAEVARGTVQPDPEEDED